MGCDGGTIPRRDELVRVKKKPEQKDKDAATEAKWKRCAITQTELHRPIVSCELGRLYNKEAVIEYLLNKDPSCIIAKHIRNLKDVKELILTENTGYQKKIADKGDDYVDRHTSLYICPVVGLEMNGKYRFCYLRECGCVLSEKALKEVKSETCHKCGKPFTENDIIIINGTDEEIILLEKNLEDRRAKAKLEKIFYKKSKKHKLDKEEAIDNGKQIKIEPGTSTAKPNDMTNGSSDVNKKSKSSSASSSSKKESKIIQSHSSASKLSLPEKARSDYSISKDPKATEAYKSLFTSHESAQNKPQAHWVTHNPLYY